MRLWFVLSAQETVLVSLELNLVVCQVKGWPITVSPMCNTVGSGSIYCLCYSCLRERAPAAFLLRASAAKQIARPVPRWG